MRILGWILAILCLLAGGGLYLAGSGIGKLGGGTGTFASDEHPVDSPARAILLSMGTIPAGHGWLTKHLQDVDLRIRIRSAAAGVPPPFLGYGQATDVTRYIAAGEFDVVRNLKLSPWSLQLQRVPALGAIPAGTSLPTGDFTNLPGMKDLLDEQGTTSEPGAAPATGGATAPGNAAAGRLRGVRPLAAGAPLPAPLPQRFWLLRAGAVPGTLAGPGGLVASELRVPIREGSHAVALVSPTGRPGVHALVRMQVHVPLVQQAASTLHQVGGIAIVIGLVLVGLLVVPRLLRGRSLPAPGLPGMPGSGGNFGAPPPPGSNMTPPGQRPAPPVGTQPPSGYEPPQGPVDYHA